MRTIFISNRLPFTLKNRGSGSYSFQPSSGGLATALNAYISALTKNNPQAKSLWVGWPGIEVNTASQQKEIREIAQEKFNSLPVFIPEKYKDTYYNGFCNQTLWPLFHYFLSVTQCRTNYWESYRTVNQIFADHLESFIQEDDIILVQDYHLLLLPRLIRKRFPQQKIGFFLHIPFPSYDVFRILPFVWQKELINGMTGANLLGFHTQEYRQNFLESYRNITGRGNDLGTIAHDNYSTYTGAFPISIDVEYFSKKSQKQSVTQHVKKLQKKYHKQKIIISVDRLDYTKGVPNRLLGYEVFLKQHPDMQKKVVFLLTIVPSRDEVDAYKKVKEEIEALVRKINSHFGDDTWQPIIYFYGSVDQDTLIALYRCADVGLLTPLRDGMNLVAKEFIAAKKNTTGVLVLSDLAGSASEMPQALTVDPFYIDDIADALKTALSLNPDEQHARNTSLLSYLSRHTVSDWAYSFQRALSHAVSDRQHSPAANPKLLQEYQDATSRLILLDYDGTLVQLASSPEKAFPTPEVITLLYSLSQDIRNDVAIVSGRKKTTLQNWLGVLPLTLVAEHGTWIKHNDKVWDLQVPADTSWKKDILVLMESMCATVPKSFIEKKEFGLVWHYNQSDPSLGEEKARVLATQLSQFIANTSLEVIVGKKVIEVKHGAVNKGTAARKLLQKKRYDCIIAIGDDQTDEDLFTVIKDIGYTFKVGSGRSLAQYNLSHVYTVHKLLELLINQQTENAAPSEQGQNFHKK